ncbi:MAG: hypothetical protein KF764_10230 [Labilithrix sp.]|nr:hypothetical protein [Labilithrix sp.]MBX3224412.1 hypothetical protein [Labilithrix sp.]
MARAQALTIALIASALTIGGCERPYLAKDGTVYFPETGARGASVMTANGLEFHDREDVPGRVVTRDPNEPWRAPIGFILPRDGRFTETSRPHVLATTGLAIVLRPSDTRVPSWGGEVLIRVDVIAPAAEGSARWGENVALVLDGEGPDTAALVGVALDQLAGRDRVSIIDVRGARVVVPSMPASHRSMVTAAMRSHLRSRAGVAPRDVSAALAAASKAVASGKVTQRVLLLTDHALGPDEIAEVSRLAQRGIQVATVSTTGQGDDDRAERADAVRAAIPAAGMTTFRSVRLTFQGTPAPSHVLEASGGEARWRLDAGDLVLGNVRAGEARTEMLRVSVPAWVPEEEFKFTVTAHVDDLAWGGPREFTAEVPCVYDDDIERIAKSRHGDVIAYASAMATLRRLDRAFVGEEIARSGGLRKVAELHAKSMQLLARDTHDFATQEQADMLVALLSATASPRPKR